MMIGHYIVIGRLLACINMAVRVFIFFCFAGLKVKVKDYGNIYHVIFISS